jgi:SAM-dependent methyltransferase
MTATPGTLDAGGAAPGWKVSLHHLVRAGASELLTRHGGRLPSPLRLLDVGFGDGDLLLYAHRWLGARWPELTLDPCGYEVREQTGRLPGYPEEVVARLGSALGGEPGAWAERLQVVGEGDGIPFPTGSFDLVLSNQVLEHVRDLDLLLREVARVLAPGGVSVHFFPTREVWLEPHVGLPLVHRCRDWGSARAAIRGLSRLGLGRWRRHGGDLETFCDWWADFLVRFAHYRRGREFLRRARACGLRASFRYDLYAYRDKLRQLLGRGPSAAFPYRSPPSFFWRPWFHALSRRLGSTTLVLALPDSPLDAG